MDEARRERFRRLFQRFGMPQPPEDLCDAAARMYRREYLQARRAMAGAEALLEAVRSQARVAIVSNNMLQEQQEKLEYCRLASHVDALIVSEEAGISKPDPQIFRIALDAVGAAAHEAVMLGDSWAADIEGARAAGIRPVWFNPARLPSPQPSANVAEIYSLEPAEKVLRVLLGVSSKARARARQP
jgi:putative hydrolase of the HAD superfamily